MTWHRAGEPGQQPGKLPGHIVRLLPWGAVGERVAVAVDLAPSDRYCQEADATSEQHRPGGHLRRAFGDEAPGELPDRPDHAGSDDELADLGMDPIGADH